MVYNYCMVTQIIDISLPLFEGMPVYPGNKATTIQTVHSLSGRSQISELGLSSHTGTHIDAPRHVFNKGASIEELSLERFYGICRVLDLTAYDVFIPRHALEEAKIQAQERILLKTKNSHKGFTVFDKEKEYVYLAPESATYLSERDVWLVGIDALSIKQRGSKDNSPHETLLSKGIPILEGLNLNAVVAGSYTLVALPLALQGIDGAPCRAVLLSL